MTDTWSRAVDLLTTEGEIGGAQLAFIRLTRPLGAVDGTLLLAVPSDFAKDFLETRAREPQRVGWAARDGARVRFAATAHHALQAEVPPAGPGPAESAPVDEPSTDDGRQEADHRGRATATASPNAAEASRLNPKYTFDTFVTGASNRFAHAAATAVAEAPAKAYNPLFIYGGSGLGKTHLLHAIGHYARNLYPDVRVRYVNSEEFTNDFINSIRDDKAEMFQRRYREVDVLLIDDIQFLQGKEQTMEEFFHTFNTLHNANKQVVITSDLAPKQLNGFEDRMRSRFEWGLLTDVQPPDLETRIAILRDRKSTRLNSSHVAISYAV